MDDSETVEAEVYVHTRVPVHALPSPVPSLVRVAPCQCQGPDHPGLYLDHEAVQGLLLDAAATLAVEEKIRIEVDVAVVVGEGAVHHLVIEIFAIVVPDLVHLLRVAVAEVVVAVTPLVVDHRAILVVDTAAQTGITIVEIEIVTMVLLRIEAVEVEEEVVVEVVVHGEDPFRVRIRLALGLLALGRLGVALRVILSALVDLGPGQGAVRGRLGLLLPARGPGHRGAEAARGL